MPWLGLGATLAWNYRRHRRGRSTICSATRRALPWTIVRLMLAGFFAWWWTHLRDGYATDRTP